MKVYITFGFSHVHSVNGRTFDKDCVAVIECEDAEKGRERAFELFSDKWCFDYPEKYWDAQKLQYFPRGYIEIE